MKKNFRILFWRAPYDILMCWLVIACSIVATVQISYWLYPLAAILIANRLLALSLLCHEGLHGNLSPNKKWNDFMGRYLCAFPCLISFSKYRRLHVLHHSSVGSDHWDPDRYLYNFFPTNLKIYLSQQVHQLFSGKTSWNFILYYTEIPEFLNILRGKIQFRSLNRSSDLIPFLGFYAFSTTVSLYFGFCLYAQIFLLLISVSNNSVVSKKVKFPSKFILKDRKSVV